jgi:AcrR family transcriptional regulator
VTVRAVAEAAGVSPALVYHHFTDKDDLIGRSLDRMAVDLSAAAEVQSPPAALRQLWRRLDERPAFARIIVWYVLEGRDVSALMSNHPLIARVAARAAEDGIGDPATLGGRMAILGLAGALLGAPVNRAIGRADTDERVLESLVGLIDVPDSASPPRAQRAGVIVAAPLVVA